MPVVPNASPTRDGYFEVRPGDVATNDALTFIDVRGEAELLGPSGHIHGVTHVPMATILKEGLPDVAKDTPIVLVCERGPRAVTCAKHLLAAGYGEVYLLVGGMARWNGEERPVARAKTWK